MPGEQPDRPTSPEIEAVGPPTAQLDVVESGRRPSRRQHTTTVRPPQVRLGTVVQGGLSPAIMAIVERGVRRRPALASSLRLEIEIELDEGYPPVRIVFGDRLVLVEDSLGTAPDLRIKASLPDLISLMVTPLVGGVPNPINPRGRAALAMVAGGRVRVEGKVGLMRKVLGVIRV